MIIGRKVLVRNTSTSHSTDPNLASRWLPAPTFRPENKSSTLDFVNPPPQQLTGSAGRCTRQCSFTPRLLHQKLNQITISMFYSSEFRYQSRCAQMPCVGVGVRKAQINQHQRLLPQTQISHGAISGARLASSCADKIYRGFCKYHCLVGANQLKCCLCVELRH